MKASVAGISLAISLVLLAGTASSQAPLLDGIYGSQGVGTVNGVSITEASVWTFSQGVLRGLSEVINFPVSGGGAFGCSLQPNQSAPLPFLLFGPTGEHQVPSSLADNRVHMVSFGCPSPSENLFSEAYLIIPENGGTQFSYLNADGEQGVFQIAGHGVKQ